MIIVDPVFERRTLYCETDKVKYFHVQNERRTMRYVILIASAIVLVSGCQHIGILFEDAGADTDADSYSYCTQGEYSGDLAIELQSDFAFLAGHTSISGDLTIHCDSCTNLNELICLTSVGGDLMIDDPPLTNLDGLSGITSVGGDLSIWETLLTNLDGLSGITSVGGDLSIGDNTLTNLDGLNGITSVGGDLMIDETLLTNLDGLGGITSVGGDLIIWDTTLTNLDGFGGITSVGGYLDVLENSTLPDCEVCELLDQLTSGPTSIYVGGNINDSCTPVPASCP